MSEKNLYLCLLAFLEPPSGKVAFRFMAAPIASSEEEAKQLAISEALSAYPQYADMLIESYAYSFQRSALERAAREILGWSPPD